MRFLQVRGQPRAGRAEGEDTTVCQMMLRVMTHPGLPQDPPTPAVSQMMCYGPGVRRRKVEYMGLLGLRNRLWFRADALEAVWEPEGTSRPFPNVI